MLAVPRADAAGALAEALLGGGEQLVRDEREVLDLRDDPLLLCSQACRAAASPWVAKSRRFQTSRPVYETVIGSYLGETVARIAELFAYARTRRGRVCR